jgi:hypothetical protein
MRLDQLINEMINLYRKDQKAVYQAWNKNAIKITYLGEEVSATAEVKANSLELAAPALTVVETIDLTAGATNILSEVVAAIDALDDWSCELGDQFDGTEASASLTIAGPSDVKTAGVWFLQDTNLQIKVVIPMVATGKKITITRVLGMITGTGAGTFEFSKDDVVVWTEAAGATTVEKVSTLPYLDSDVGEQVVLKLKMATTLTAGYLTVAYEERAFDAVPLF